MLRPSTPDILDACVIGAGGCGLAAAKALHDRGLAFDCFERGSAVGGLWRYDNDNGMSAIYKSLQINTSRDMTSFADFPMPADYPDFPRHEQIRDYLERYVDRFGFRDRIRFRTTVERVVPEPGGTFAVTFRSGEGATATCSSPAATTGCRACRSFAVPSRARSSTRTTTARPRPSQASACSSWEWATPAAISPATWLGSPTARFFRPAAAPT
jgi:phytoene dehydrogenase-like protein